MTQILLLIHGVSGCIPREGLAQSDQPSVAALWSGGAGIAANNDISETYSFKTALTLFFNEDNGVDFYQFVRVCDLVI